MIRLQRLTVKGFKNLDINNLEFPENGNILVIGRNESGKSSLFEAIYFALTGKVLVFELRSRLADSIAFNKNSATIELSFSKNQIPAKIQRKITKTRTGVSDQVKFWINYNSPEEVLSTGKGKSLQAEINEFLGFDSDVLLNSCFVQQKKIDGLIQKTPRERRKIIDRLLNLEVLTELKESYIKERKISTVVREVYRFQKEIESSLHNLDNLSKITKKHKTLDDNFSQFSAIQAKLEDLQRTTQDLDSISQNQEKNLKALTKQISELQTKKTELKKTQKLLQREKATIAKRKMVEQATSHNLTKIKDLKIQNDAILKDLTEYDQKIIQKSKNEKLEVEQIKLQKKLNEQYDKIKKIQDFDRKEVELKKDTQNAKKIQKGKISDLSQGQKRIIKHITTQISLIKTKITELALIKKEIKANEEKSKEISQKIKSAEELKKAQEQLIKLTGIKDKTNSDLKLILKNLEDLEKLQKNLKSTEEKLTQQEADHGKLKAICIKLEKDITQTKTNLQLRKKYDKLTENIQKNEQNELTVSKQIQGKLESVQKIKDILRQLGRDPSAQIKEIDLRLTNNIAEYNERQNQIINSEKSVLKSLQSQIQDIFPDKKTPTFASFRYWLIGSILGGILFSFLGFLVQPFLFVFLLIPVGAFFYAFMRYKNSSSFSNQSPEIQTYITSLQSFLEGSVCIKNKFRLLQVILKEKPTREEITTEISKLDKNFEIFIPLVKQSDNLQSTAPLLELQTLAQEIYQDKTKIQHLESTYKGGVKEKSEQKDLQEKEKQEIEELKGKLLQFRKQTPVFEADLDKFHEEIRHNSITVWNETWQSLEKQLSVSQTNNKEILKQIKENKEKILKLAKSIKKSEKNEDRRKKSDLEGKLGKTTLTITRIQQTIVESPKTTVKYDLKQLQKEKKSIGNITGRSESKRDGIKNILRKTSTDLHITSKFLPESDDYYQDIYDQSRIMEGKPILKPLDLQDEEFFLKIKKFIVFFETFMGIQDDLKEIKQDLEEFLENKKQQAEVNVNKTDILKNRERILLQIEEKYQNDFNKLKNDLEKNSVQITETKLSQKNLKKYFDSTKREKLIAQQQKNKEDEEKEQKKQISLQKERSQLEKKLGEILTKIPAQYQNSGEETPENMSKIDVDITQNQNDIVDKTNEKTQTESEFKTKHTGFLKAFNQFISHDLIKASIPSSDQKSIKNFKSAAELFRPIQIMMNTEEKIFNKEFDSIATQSKIPFDNEGEVGLEQRLDKFATGLKVEISRNKDLIKRNKQEAKRIKIVSKARKRIEKEASSGKSSQEKYTKVDKEIQILIKAIEILEEGTSQISRKVLPKTNENLSRILPILTAGRYKDSKIEYDYKILLFDSKRKGYVNKVLYSGGTNDQIALAVRLAFAMATMQEEALGESFIFLDEPLGFFDDERRHALIDFLTHGVISQKFAQRFVVSNYLEIKPYFDYVIELENGKIINEHYTGTLESQQAEIQGQYTSANQVKMLELKTIKGEEEDGCYYGILHLINVSSHTITRLKLTILDNIYVDIGTTNFYEPILPQTFIKLEPNFSDEILTMGEIHVKAHIKYLIGKQLHSLEQTIIYVPELK